MDSTFLKNIPIDNVVSDVMVMMIPLSRIPEMAEVLVTIFDLEMTGTLQEPPPKKVSFGNVIDHPAYEELMTRLFQIEHRNPNTAQRAVILNAAINLTGAM